ncbi:hypothetical protein JX266_006745 [Neoarthrinium moseri]|uniref:uncharacterized protein n=1 Tax=Neoarthrinium moseri TaxID=1658444 RepID=UPI001FDC93FA|nr:uncharacterized protein JN550_010401 [Neoarthrinium moseri]KAI1847205.1 hypothetical protein JX266_006745 [Neoarthrinium moseri]KAI1862245.1 hypothetical protein JN550_010401 [Neoarthrinium moseri]
MASSLSYAAFHYGSDSELQRVGVWEVDTVASEKSKYWIIYIHGGAWRDPRIDHKSFIPTIDAVISSQDECKSSISGFASVDYRLSPHPGFPQDPEGTTPRDYRNAFHPDHIKDVWSALRSLQERYAFGSNYVLLGHSAGATLALQLLMGSTALKGSAPPADVALPAAIVGLEGIYDLQGLVDRLGPEYAALFVGAFGDSSNWSDVSPMKFTKSFRSAWSEEHLVVLGWSPEDELIDRPEIEGMQKVLEKDNVNTLALTDLSGTHDGMWEDGRPFAQVIRKTLNHLKR